MQIRSIQFSMKPFGKGCASYKLCLSRFRKCASTIIFIFLSSWMPFTHTTIRWFSALRSPPSPHKNGHFHPTVGSMNLSKVSIHIVASGNGDRLRNMWPLVIGDVVVGDLTFANEYHITNWHFPISLYSPIYFISYTHTHTDNTRKDINFNWPHYASWWRRRKPGVGDCLFSNWSKCMQIWDFTQTLTLDANTEKINKHHIVLCVWRAFVYLIYTKIGFNFDGIRNVALTSPGSYYILRSKWIHSQMKIDFTRREQRRESARENTKKQPYPRCACSGVNFNFKSNQC